MIDLSKGFTDTRLMIKNTTEIKKEIKLAEKEYTQYMKLAQKALEKSHALQRKLEGKPPLKKKKVSTYSFQPYSGSEVSRVDWLLKSR